MFGFGKVKIIGLDAVDMTNHDLFIRKSYKKLKKDAVLLVEDTHSAILVKNGEMINTLSTGRYSIFEKGEDSSDTLVDVIFMSKTAKLRTLWGTSQKMVVRDPKTSEYMGIGASGEYEIQVSNPRKFYLEVIGASKTYTIDDLKARLLGRIANEIEKVVAVVAKANDITYDRIAEYKTQIADEVLPLLQSRFERDYGIKIHTFMISKILVSPATSKDLDKSHESNEESSYDSIKEQFLNMLKEDDYSKYERVVAILEEDEATTTETANTRVAEEE